MNVQILMSTMHRSAIDDLCLKNRNIDSDILIINQTDNEKTFAEAHNIRMINVCSRGTPSSRNLALAEASGDICIFADDDIAYIDNYKNIIIEAFNKQPNADIITFQIMHPDGTPFKDNYMKNSRKHTLRTALKCASIEIAFRRSSISRKNLHIDCEFGLGTRYRIHDDVIFIADAIKAGLNVYYEPIPIVIHPLESSGTLYNRALVQSKGAAFYRIYSIWAYMVDIAFAIVKYRDYKAAFKFIEFINLIFSGTTEYMKTH